MLACIPPFESVCVLTVTALIGVFASMRMRGAPPDPAPDGPAAPDGRRPSRVWVWAALYLLFIVALFAGLLALGVWIDPVGDPPGRRN